MKKNTLWTLAIVALVVLGVGLTAAPQGLRGALFQINPGAQNPVTGIFLSRGYEAQPNERGTVLLQAGETLFNFEGLEMTLAVDSSRASIVRVNRTAVTQNFDISLRYSAPGVVHVALVGNPKTINQGGSLLEFEMQLADSSVNTTFNRIEMRMLDVRYIVESGSLKTKSHDGLITFVTSQNALDVPFSPFISDVDPGSYPLVRNSTMLIRGQAFPASPRVLLGSRPISVISASSQEIVAQIPEDTLPGTYAVSVESLLSQEDAVVLDAPGVSGSVDILEELLFFTPNPLLFNAQVQTTDVVLWVPVFNPLGADDPVIGSVDFSAIGGEP